MPIQAIDSRRLPAGENLWLEGLRKRLGPLEVLQLSEAGAREDDALVGPYFHVIAQANPDAIEEATNMGKSATTIEEVLERTGFNARAEKRAEERNSLKIAQKMIDSGFPLETVSSMTELEPEKIKALCQGKVKVKR